MCLHEAVLECCLGRVDSQSENIVAANPVDLLVLYKAVASLFSNWEQALPDISFPLDLPHFLNIPEANDNAKHHANPRVREGLRRFGVALQLEVADKQAPIDLLFAYRLITSCLDSDTTYLNIMSGRLGEVLLKSRKDPLIWWGDSGEKKYGFT